MTDDMHPGWHSTGDEGHSSFDIVPPKQSAPAKRIPIGSGSISRLPSAILGILLVIGIGLFYARGSDLFPQGFGFLGQATPPDIQTPVEIHITNTGIVPAEANVQPGQTIIWSNDQDMPHILQSETVKDASGDYLYSPAIFPGSTYSFILSASQENGRFDYGSLTAQNLQGVLIVGQPQSSSSADAPVPSLESSSSLPPPSSSSQAPVLTSPPPASSSASSPTQPSIVSSRSHVSARSSVVAFVSSSSDDSVSSSSQAFTLPSADDTQSSHAIDVLLPVNPYTVGTVHTPTTSDQTNDGFSTSSRTSYHSSSTRLTASTCGTDGTHCSAPKNLNQSGPEIWVTLAGSLIAIAWFGRKSLRVSVH